MDSLGIIKSLEKRKKLTELEKILAVTTGSVTQILEAHFGKPVRIRTVSQEVREAGRFGKLLDVKKTDAVNFREVGITCGGFSMQAKSWIPLKRLEPEFKDDLMKADEPIGKLLLKHKIESRRELLEVKVEGGRIVRTYNIIHKGGILMRIEERF